MDHKFRYYLKRLSLLILTLVPLSMNAQRGEAYRSEFEGRLGASVGVDLFDKTLGIKFSPEVRSNGLEYDKTLLKLSLDYDLFDVVKVGVAGRVTFNKTKKGVKQYGRFNLDLSRSFAVQKLRIKPRVRYAIYTGETNNFDLMRYELALGYKYKKKALFEPELSAELFQSLRDGLMHAVRITAGGDFRLSKGNKIGLYYHVQPQFEYRHLTHCLKLTYKFSFN